MGFQHLRPLSKTPRLKSQSFVRKGRPLPLRRALLGPPPCASDRNIALLTISSL
jgi:hypothetical protein